MFQYSPEGIVTLIQEARQRLQEGESGLSTYKTFFAELAQLYGTVSADRIPNDILIATELFLAELQRFADRQERPELLSPIKRARGLIQQTLELRHSESFSSTGLTKIRKLGQYFHMLQSLAGDSTTDAPPPKKGS